MTDDGLSPQTRAWLASAGSRTNEPAREDRPEDVQARIAELPPWLLNLVHEVGLAAEEIACNGDHETHEGCDGCAWEALHEAVPVRIRNAADEAAAR